MSQAPDWLPSPLKRGDTIAEKYRVEALLGEGGFARVYRARHARIPTLVVAVKVLRTEHSVDPRVRARFQQEAATVAALSSRHTVRVTDFGELPSGEPFMALDYVEGVLLERLIRRDGGLRPSDTARLALGILQALQEAHGLGVVHRDLKPANVFVARDRAERHPIPRVLDFGIAKVLTGSLVPTGGGGTATGGVICTPQYAAPELLRGDPVPASDLYALGHVMAEMLDGHPPYRTDHFFVTASLHLGAAPVPIGERARASGLAAVIERACAKSLEARYGSAAEMAADLRRAYRGVCEDPEGEEPLGFDVLPSELPLDAREAETVAAASDPSLAGTEAIPRTVRAAPDSREDGRGQAADSLRGAESAELPMPPEVAGTPVSGIGTAPPGPERSTSSGGRPAWMEDVGDSLEQLMAPATGEAAGPGETGAEIAAMEPAIFGSMTERNELDCPHCRKRLTHRSYPASGLDAMGRRGGRAHRHSCRRCGLDWFDFGQLDFLFGIGRREMLVLAEPDQNAPPPARLPRCPRDGSHVVGQRLYGAPLGVCPTCGGMLFPAGALERALAPFSAERGVSAERIALGLVRDKLV